jgi:hypothetical protein
VKLTCIGYWLGPYALGWPDVRDFVDPGWDLSERQAVGEWLQAGELFVAFLGYSECRFCGIRNGSVELTDGVYLWPAGLAHYLSDHDVRLPNRIVKHALQLKPVNRTRLTKVRRTESSTSPEQGIGAFVDVSWWLTQRADWTASATRPAGHGGRVRRSTHRRSG